MSPPLMEYVVREMLTAMLTVKIMHALLEKVIHLLDPK